LPDPRRRVAIVGTGFGVRVQLPAFRLAGGWEVVSLTGSDAAKTRHLAETLGVPHACATLDEALDRGAPDLVCVATPPHLHLPMAAAVLTSDRHCLLEKPTALDATEAEALCAAAASSTSLALIDHELRALPARREARRRIQAGDLGRILSARVVFTSPGAALPARRWSWFASRAHGGGLLGAIGSHVVDHLRWWLGEITSVRARLTTSVAELPAEDRPRVVETDDGADLALRFADGTPASVSLTSVAHSYEGFRWEVHGVEGSMWIDEAGELWIAPRSSEERQRVPIEDGLGSDPVLDGSLWARGMVLFAGDLHRAVTDGVAPGYAATFDDGRATQRVLDAARTSDKRDGQEIGIPTG
jgi:predicted dehydrogenase